MNDKNIAALSLQIKEYICMFVAETILFIEKLKVVNVSRESEDEFLRALTQILASFVDGRRAESRADKLLDWLRTLRALDTTNFWLNELRLKKRIDEKIAERIAGKIKMLADEINTIRGLTEENNDYN